MSLPLPQALRVLDQHQASDPTSAVQSLLTDHGLSATPDQLTTLVAALQTASTRVVHSWPEGRPTNRIALVAQEHELTESIACEEARLAQIRGRSFYRKTRDYFRNDWPRIWQRKWRSKGYWAFTFGFHGFFAGVGALFAVDHQGSALWGAAIGELIAQAMVMAAYYIAITIDDVPETSLPDLKARQHALTAWIPSAVELRLWRSAPQVHTQVAALMASPIGLRQGDRRTVETWMHQALAQDDAPDAQQRFLQDRPAG